MRVKPLASTSSTFSGVMPPMAKAGRRISAATWRSRSRPGKSSKLLGRRGKRRTDADVVGAVEHGGVGPDRSSASRRRSARRGPTIARASLTLMSSWPRWTPSASTTAATSGRSLMMASGAGHWRSVSRDARRAAGSERQFAIAEPLVAELNGVDARGHELADEPGKSPASLRGRRSARRAARRRGARRRRRCGRGRLRACRVGSAGPRTAAARRRRRRLCRILRGCGATASSARSWPRTRPRRRLAAPRSASSDRGADVVLRVARGSGGRARAGRHATSARSCRSCLRRAVRWASSSTKRT